MLRPHTAMERYHLADLYSKLTADLGAGRLAAAHEGLCGALGFDFPAPPSSEAVSSAAARLAGILSYRGFKPAELAQMAAGVREVVKCEDIPVESASRFVARFQSHYRIVVGPPYVKDYLRLRSMPAQPDDPAAPRLVSIYLSRNDAGRRLLALENARRDDVAGAGALLGFPPCCIEAFARAAATSRVDQDTVNDDACRDLLRSVAPGGAGHPALNPLADAELLGFYPCRLDCLRAVERARPAAGALAAVESGVRIAAIQRQLERPVLYFRLPFFAAIDGLWEPGGLRVAAVLVNGFPDPTARQAQALFAATLHAWLAPGDVLHVEGADLVRVRSRRSERWPARSADAAPVLVRWQPWPERFFDPGAEFRQPTP
ncbi:MAG: hypothetical protein EXR79_00630 [Myxococcales bacterium]|nr:hypothetical protein [Myxococcales bacterium]